LWKDPVLVRHRLVDRAGAEAGYTVRAACPSGSHDTETLRAVDEEYRHADLAALTEGRLLSVQATPALLAGAVDLLGDIAQPLLEVPSWLLEEPEVDQLMAEQKAHGVALALGDFRGTPAQLGALEMVQTVMVDAEDPDLARIIEARGDATVIARGPATRASLERALAAGADMAEAAWVYPDDERHEGQLAAVEAHCLELLAMLDRQPAEPAQVADLISTSPELSVAVLRQVNSSAVALRHRVDSVPHATVLAGPRRLRTIAVAALSGARSDGVDALWAILSRAHAVAELTGREAGYTTGLLSGLADVRRFPIDWLTERAGVSSQVSAALLARRGQLGSAVGAVAAHEAGDPAGVATLGMDPWAVSRAWITAVVESRELLPGLT